MHVAPRSLPSRSLALALSFALHTVSARAQTTTGPAAPLEARLVAARSRVEVSVPTTHAGAVGESLPRGARVVTGHESDAVIEYPGVGFLQLAEDSQLLMFDSPNPQAANAPPRTETTLIRGAVRVVVNGPGRAPITLPLATAGGMIRLPRGEYRIGVDGSRVTRVAVYRGRARVSSGAEDISVRQGQALRIDYTTGPVPVLPPGWVPSAPTWRESFPQSLMATTPTVDLAARFAPAAQQAWPTARWHLQLARDADFNDLVVDRAQPGADTRFAASALPAGSYFARVMAVNAERIESMPSAVQRIRIVAPRFNAGSLGHRASVVIPQGFWCSLDGALTMPGGSTFTLVPAVDHAMRCAPNAQLRGAITIPIGAAQSGPLVHDVLVEGGEWHAGGGLRTLAVRLRDATGHPLPYAHIEVRANPGVSVDPLRESDERGVYTAMLRWNRDTEVDLQLTVNGAISFTHHFGPEGESALSMNP